MSKCMSCKNAVLLTGAYTSTCYLECKLEQEFAETASLEELNRAIKEGIRPCKYRKGKPIDGGITFDD